MISYETYKTLHLIFILIFFTSLGFIFNETALLKKRMGKLAILFISFLIFVAGMGLVARLNLKHSEAFPLWIRLKVGIWLVINLLFVLFLKIKKSEMRLMLTGLILSAAVFAVWVAIHKPLFS